MLKMMDKKDPFLCQFDQLEKSLVSVERCWFLPTRKSAIARFAELGFPTTRHEEWQHTNVTPMARTEFASGDSHEAAPAAEQIGDFLFDGQEVSRLVFVNGRFAERLSRCSSLPSGVTAGSLAAEIGSMEPTVQAHLARHAGYQDEAFAALNTALVQDGAFVHVAKGTIVEGPIHLLFITTADDHALVCHPRALIVAEAGSQVTIVETYAGVGSGQYFTNAVTEVVAKDNAVIDHYKIVREGHQAFHIGTLHLHQFRDSNVSSHTVTMSGGLVRNDITAILDGEGCDCTLNGLYMLNGDDHVDNHLRVEHAKPHCNSRECFKGVLDDRSCSVFSGRIIVHKNAQKTDAKQANMNLLLSDEALANSKPQLEILADDVKCTHGATIGQVDADAVFYLRSRGISEEAARSLLIYAFAKESLDCVRVPALKAQLEKMLLGRLPHGDLLQEAS
ncbi:MAG: Fe-S cluster assembly protein SufD [Phycisphaerae bacterium]